MQAQQPLLLSILGMIIYISSAKMELFSRLTGILLENEIFWDKKKTVT